MARLLTSGAEWNDLTAEGLTAANGTPVSQTSNVRSGARAWGSSTATDSLRFTFTGALATTYLIRTAVFFTAWTTTGLTSPVCSFGNASGNRPALIVDEFGNLGLYTTTVGGTLIGSTTLLSLSTWYVLELATIMNGSTSDDYAEARMNGVSLGATTTANLSLTAPTNATFNLAGNGMACAQDDLAVNDSTGAAQNSWPGISSVVLLKPTADSAVGTGWTLGNTTATGGNAWSRLDNTPPDSATDLTANADAMQIRNATSNANVNYDATMQTYTAAGVTGTVNVVVPQVATGAPVVTSAKAGTVGVASNPAIANISLGAGGTSGAFWSGVATGTYPTGNKWSFGTTTYAPTVTLGTAPVMRVTQVTASTRIAIVTEMGIYVDYTPAVTTLPPLPVYVDSAVARSTSY